jgi:hypothetical protein
VLERDFINALVSKKVGSPIIKEFCYDFHSCLRNVGMGYVPKWPSIPSHSGNLIMSRPNIWATKVAALVTGGNSTAALAQIKVAPTVKDLQQLRALLTAAKVLTRHPNVDDATRDQIVALSSPRLHRSP